MKKILAPFGYAELGGSQLSFLKLAKNMDSKQFQFVSWVFDQGPLIDELRKEKIHLSQFPKSQLKTPWGLWQTIKELKREKPDLIYLHASRSLAFLAKILKIPCIERINMSRLPEAGGWCRYAFLDRFLTNLNTKILTVSSALKDQMMARGIPENKITVIRNYVDVKKFQKPELRRPTRQELNIPDEATVVLNIGRMVPQKGQADYLQVASECLKKDNKFFFILLGEGPLYQDFVHQAKSLNLNDRLKILPFTNEIEKYYAAADIYLHTAHWEPLANVLLEAMAAGLSVVATDVDGTGEALKNYPPSKIVAAKDIKALSDGVIYFSKNPQIEKCPINKEFTRPYFLEKITRLFDETKYS